VSNNAASMLMPNVAARYCAYRTRYADVPEDSEVE